jgi:hypothetical protein
MTDRRYTKERWSNGVVAAPRSFYSRLFAVVLGTYFRILGDRDRVLPLPFVFLGADSDVTR